MSIYLYLYLSISIYLYLSLSISIYLYLSPSISIYLYLSLSIYLYHFSIYLSIYLFEVDNIENETIPRDFFQKWKVECRADGLVPMRFAIFPLHLSKVLCLPRKSDAGSYEVLHLSRKIIFPKLKI